MSGSELGTSVLREISVFVSSPGDVVTERRGIERILREVDAVVRVAGITIVPWQYDRNGHPGRGIDAQDVLNQQSPEAIDLYVGILCGRLGTPTGRAASGTVEEFERAVASGGQTFLYFCAGLDACPKPSSAQVRAWRDTFKGLYWTFKGPEDLAETFKQHLLLWVMRTHVLPNTKDARRDTSPPRVPPPWLTAIEKEIEQHRAVADSYRDLSIRWPRRVLSKLDALFDLPSHLSTDEDHALIAVVHLLQGSECEDSSSTERWASLLSWDAEFAKAVSASRDAVHPAGDRDEDGAEPNIAGIRTDLIAALVRLGLMLDLDRGSLRRTSSPAPSHDGPLDDWRAHLTRRIQVTRGLVRFDLEIPDATWEEPLRACTALALEATWQRVRHVLTNAGLSMAIAPSETALPALRRPASAVVLARLEDEARLIVANFPLPPHLGETNTATLDRLLPLPDTAVAADVRFACGAGASHRLIVEDSSGTDTFTHSSDGPSIDVDYQRLRPGTTYRWELSRADTGFGDETIGSGSFRTLTESQRALWQAALTLGQGARDLLCVELDLRDELLKSLWPRLDDKAIPPEHRLLALRVLTEAARTAEEQTPWSMRVEAYRDATRALFDVITRSTFS